MVSPTRQRRPVALWAPVVLLFLAACGDATTSQTPTDLFDVTEVPDTAGDVAVDLGADDTAVVPDATSDTTDTTDSAEVDTGESDAGSDADDTTDGSADPGDPCLETECFIDDACVEGLALNADNPCEICLVARSRTEWSANDDAPCDDGDACTLGEYCFEGACTAPLRTCDNGNVCTAGTCNADSGECEFAPVEGTCDDNNACTIGDTCADGACGGTGTRACDDGNPCTVERCDPELGCVSEPADGISCDDGNFCTVEDTCFAGTCAAGAPADCDDDNLCTVDRCIPATGCDYAPLDYLCADENPCTDETCDPTQGCVYPFNNDPCDDGDLCTSVDTCTGGACLGSLVDPNDANPCTNDFCDPLGGNFYEDNTFVCDDNNACTVGDICAEGGCVAGTTPLTCEDDNVCTDHFCDPATGCGINFNTAPCNDNNVCTIEDTCGSGSCGGSTISCDDGNDCTADSCDSVTGCANTLIVSNACRPTILVTYPPRGASIQATDAGGITVTGRVFSGAGPIETFTLNGVSVTPDSTSGEFSVPFTSDFGNNILIFEAADSFGTERRRVQSYLWAETWFRDDDALGGAVPGGVGVTLTQSVFDELSGVFAGVIGGLDIASLLGGSGSLTQGQSATYSGAPLSGSRRITVPNNERLTFLTTANEAGVDIVVFLRERGTYSGGNFTSTAPAVSYGAPTVTLAIIDNGLRLNARIPNLRIELRLFRFGLLSGLIPETANVTATSVNISTIARLTVVDGQLVVAFDPSDVTFTNPASSNTILNFVIGSLIGSLTPSLESSVDEALGGDLANTLAGALGALALSFPFDLPSFGGGDPISVNLSTEFQEVNLRGVRPETPASAGIILRANADTATLVSPYIEAGLGAPSRSGCAFGAGQPLTLPRLDDFELALQDDTLTRVLYAAWAAGLLEQPVPASLFEGIDLASFGVQSLSLDLSAMLPPALSDCGAPGENPLLQIGDLIINADVGIFGQVVPLTVYVSAEIRLAIEAGVDGISISLLDVETVELEVQADDPSQIGLESVFRDLLEAQLETLLGGLLGGATGTPLFSFPLPAIDLGSITPGSPPTTLIIQTTGAVRQNGTNVISGTVTTSEAP